MNLIGLCLVLGILLTGGFSVTISEASSVQEVGDRTDEKVPTREETFIENEDADDDFETVIKFVQEFLWPVNETQASTPDEGRTFGVKRLQFMMMPMIYKMGVMMTMLTVLTVISLKGLAIGVLLLVLKLSTFFGKLYASTQHHAPYQAWPTQPQPVHVHLHNTGGPPPPTYHHHPYNGWESAGPPVEDEHYYYKG